MSDKYEFHWLKDGRWVQAPTSSLLVIRHFVQKYGITDWYVINRSSGRLVASSAPSS